MQHFKEFLIKLQTLDIKVNQRNKIINGEVQKISFYDISHQNPFLSASFKNELKELKELAITDILNLPREQIIFQLQRLTDVKELFGKFWHNFYHSNVPAQTEHLLDYLFSLDLHTIFIAPTLSQADHAVVEAAIIDDLMDSIRARENILKEFEEAVSKVVDLSKETEKSVNTKPLKKVAKANPVFKGEIVQEFFKIVKL